jgi:adenylate cyclase
MLKKSTLKKLLTSPWTALITLALILSIRIADPVFVESVRLRYFDTLITAQPPTPTDIYTVNIDEDTIAKHGQWPFDRRVYANLIEELYKRNAGLVIFNVMMPERDRSGGDGSLAATLNELDVILPNLPADRMKNTPKQPGTAVIGAEFSDQIVQYPGIIANIDMLEKRAKGVGIVATLPEVDGVNRRMPLVVAVDGRVYPSLAMEVLRVSAGDSTTQIKLTELGVEKMRIPAFGPIATDSLGRIWIDWSQRSQSVSAINLPKDFGGADVIVGVAAGGLGNPVPTPRGSVWPHEVQAAVIATMFNGVTIERPDYADGVEIIFIAVMGLIIIGMSRWTYAGILISIVGVIAPVVASGLAYSEWRILADATASTAGLVLVALHTYGVKFISEFLQKQQIKKQFGTYLSPDLVAQLQRNPDLLVLGGDSRELSIMFTDVRGFTSISEHYGKDVQGLTKIMNRYMTAMTKKILENKGTLDKYIGDAQMAFWNAPLDNTQHAKDAVKTGLEMLGSLDEFNKEVQAEGVPPFGMGLGINTDTVVVGNMGSDQRFDYTCLGDGVNLASRLEGQSKPYGVKIVVGAKTAEYVKDEYLVLELDCIAVKGKKEGVNIYTVLGHRDELRVSSADTQMHDAMLNLYRQQKFDQAVKFCNDLMGRFNGAMDHYYEMWQERCVEMKSAGLPLDWDGIYRATSK